MKKILLYLFLLCPLAACSSINIDDSGKKSEFSLEVYALDSKAPTVLIAHGCDGAGNPEYHQWGRTLNEWGYNAVLVDSFSGRGFTSLCNRGSLVSFPLRAVDLLKVAEWINTQKWHNGSIGVIGFSMGGSTIIALEDRVGVEVWGGPLRDQKLKISAAVAFYPQCRSGGPVKNPTIPTMIHFGMQDKTTPPESCGYRSLTSEKYSIVLHETGGHAFDQRNPRFYDRTSDQQSRKLTKDFFDKHLK